MAKINIPTLKLNNGAEIPALGYGTWLGWSKTGEFNWENRPRLMEALSYAIDIGYRHIDTAHLYRVEPEVGLVINKKIQDGTVKREDFFINTKVWQHFHRECDVEVSLRASLERLNLDYVDSVLMHWPMAISQDGVDEKIDYLETWRGFEACLAKGLTKSIGVSNFNVEQLTRLLKNCKVPPSTHQIEVNLNLAQEELVSFSQANGIVVVAYSPFGTMVPSHAVPNSPEPKLNNPTMLAIAKKYGKSVTQIALRHLFQRGMVVIPKTTTKSRVLENASIFDFTLDQADVDTLSAFDCGYRFEQPLFWQHYTNYPFETVPILKKMDIPIGLRQWKERSDQD